MHTQRNAYHVPIVYLVKHIPIEKEKSENVVLSNTDNYETHCNLDKVKILIFGKPNDVNVKC